MMKKLLILTAMALTFGPAFVTRSVADEPPPSSTSENLQNDKHFSGTVTAVNPKERIVSVKYLLFTRHFNVGEGCKVRFEDKPTASLADLHPGLKVKISYQNVQGVLVADQINQENLIHTGRITTIDAANRQLVIKQGAFNRHYVLAQECPVILNNGETGTLESLSVGQTVNVTYEPKNDSLTAVKIERGNETFTGVIRGIDASTKTVKARSGFTDRVFHLANGCVINVPGKTDASISDLRIGDRASFTYDNVKGVWVADWIAQTSHDAEAGGAQSAKSDFMVQ